MKLPNNTSKTSSSSKSNNATIANVATHKKENCESSSNHPPNETNNKKWNINYMTHLEANIDDATPELLAHTLNVMLENGAVDAWIHPIVMKKGRSAHTLHCLCHEKNNNGDDDDDDSSGCSTMTNKLLELLFRHTTTLGIRIQRNVQRAALHRSFKEVQLPFLDNERKGVVNVKLGILGGNGDDNSNIIQGEVVSVKAEFDHCKVISEQSMVPLKRVQEMAERIVHEEIFPLSL
mmetsp:Transcript_23468/g.34525  ORF Transcript_23468/g.34525 Transcript_23468/m.34525 type:complete len:235 (+) Transcript_23468:872-1576(+)